MRDDAVQHVELARAMGGIEGPFIGVVEAARVHADALLGGDTWAAMEQLRERAESLMHPDCTVDRLVARLAERWHARLSRFFGHDLRGRQVVILYAVGAHFRQPQSSPAR